MLFEILIVAGTGTLAFALRSFRHPGLFRTGTLGLVGTSFLAGWLIGGSVVAGLLFASTWFLLPWMEILTRVRRMRLPAERNLEQRPPPPRSVFPALEELSSEMEDCGFAYVEDTGWTHDDTRHFSRHFLNPDRTTISALCLIEQGEFAFYYVFFRSKASDGRMVITWNYPFSYGLHQYPGTFLNRIAGEPSIEDLCRSHERFLPESLGGAARTVDPEAIQSELQEDFRGQLNHNLACGILCREGDSAIRYTVRGMFFLWFQFLRDFVRFS